MTTPAPTDAAGVPRTTPVWRRLVAFLVTVPFPGISQADDGEIRRGALWFLGINAPVTAAWLLAYAARGRPWLAMGIVVAALVAAFGLTLRLAIDGYRRERSPERRGPAKRVIAIYAAFVLAGFAFGFARGAVREYLLGTYHIPSISMEPTLMVGDRIVVDRAAYRRGRHPKAGDVAVFIFPEDREKLFIKRVVAVPGDTVEIRGTRLFINGTEIRDAQAVAPGNDDEGASRRKTRRRASRDERTVVRLPEGKYYTLGDNRRRSYDSRHFGAVDEADIEGKLAFIYYSRDPRRIGMTFP